MKRSEMLAILDTVLKGNFIIAEECLDAIEDSINPVKRT